MKITYIAPIRLPTERAHGYAIMKLCEEFARLGHEVDLIVPDKWAPALKEKDPFTYYGVDRIFSVSRVHSTDFLGKEDGRGRISFWLDLWSFIFLAKIRYRERLRSADIIYTRDFRLVSYLDSIRVALEVHDIPPQVEEFSRAVKSAKFVVAISKGLAQKIKEVSGRGALVAPDAVDLKRFSHTMLQSDARTKLGLPQDKKIALYMGHFYAWKGAEVFGDAAALLPDVCCILAGGVEPDFERIKEKYKESKNVQVLPFQDPSLVPVYLAAADILILPNRSDSEISAKYTSPLKLFEYMAMGKPIVASDLQSLGEILDDQTAILVKPDNANAIAEGIHKILNDHELSERMASNAKEKANGYSWSARAQKIIDSIK